MKTYDYNDGLKSGGRRPRLYLWVPADVGTGTAHRFTGAAIAGVCVIVASRFEKNGKWSNTDYTLGLRPDVVPVQLLPPLHGTWGDRIQSWAEAARVLGIPEDHVRAIIRAEYKSTADRLDLVEQFERAIEVQTDTPSSDTGVQT